MNTRQVVFRSLSGALIAMTLAGAAAAAKPPRRKVAAPTLPELNRKVLEFARSQVGNKVGDGECSTLARDALVSAGARVFPWERSGNFIWGRPVSGLAQALPGDIIQFRDAVFDGKAWVSSVRWISWHYEYPHHTAIVTAVRNDGAEVLVLHQNVHGATSKEPLKIVQEGTLWPKSLKPGGHLWIYRPIAPDEDPSEPAAATPGPERSTRARR